MKRRMISLLLALALLVCLVPVTAPKAEAVRVATEMLVEPQYEDAGSFSEGYAPVMKDGKWALINEKDEPVTEFIYDWIGFFSEGVAVAAIFEELTYEDMDWVDLCFVLHLIDGEGNDIVLEDENVWGDEVPVGYDYMPLKYYGDYPGLMENGSTWFCNDGVVRASGNSYTPDGQLIVFDSYDQLFTSEDYGSFNYVSQMGPCVDGVIPMRAGIRGLADGYGQCFYMDTEGNIIKLFDPCCWDDGTGISLVYAPDNGLIVACQLTGDGNGAGCTYLYGIMDENGSWVVEPSYSDFYFRLNGEFFHDGLMAVADENGLFGAINTEGETVIDHQYAWMGVFSQGFAAVKDADGKCSFVDTEGNVYKIAALDGGEANIAVASSFNTMGMAAVYDADSGKAYCISAFAENGVLPVVEDSEDLGREVYFPEYTGEGTPGVIYPPSDIIAVQDENGLWGYRKLDLKGLNPFNDVANGEWYTDPIIWAVDEGITNGTTATTFSPEDLCTRAQVVTFLWRTMGSPEPTSTENPFEDVVEGEHTSWYYKAVLWAVENGITNGRDETHFAPDGQCLRSEVVMFLWRTAQKPASTLTGNSFQDTTTDHWFYEPVMWAVGDGITNGTTPTTFSPDEKCTRAQIVTFLYRYAN